MHEASNRASRSPKTGKIRVEKAFTEADAEHQKRLQDTHAKRRRQAYWRARLVPESQAPEPAAKRKGRGTKPEEPSAEKSDAPRPKFREHPFRRWRAYDGRALRRLALPAPAFWRLGTEFARLLGIAPTPVPDATPEQRAQTAITAFAPATQDGRGRPAYRWRRNRYFDTTDDLLLFCLLYHRDKVVRSRYVLIRGEKEEDKEEEDKDRLLPRPSATPAPMLTPIQAKILKKTTQTKLIEEFKERRVTIGHVAATTMDHMEQSTVSRWLTRSTGRLVEALRNYRHGTPIQQAIAARVLPLSAELAQQVQQLGPPPATAMSSDEARLPVM